MAIIVSGTTIPTSGDYIKVGSTLVDKVDVVKNGVRTTVWEKQKSFYVWKDGTPYSGYYPSSYLEKASPSYNMQFEYRNGNYGMTVSNIRTNEGYGTPSLLCGYTIPDISVSGCKKVSIKQSVYLDNGQGGRTWSLIIYGINSSGVSTELLKHYYYESSEFSCNINGYSKIRIKTHLDCGQEGLKDGVQCIGCTVGFYINYIYLEQ